MHKNIIILLICTCGLFIQHVCLKIQLFIIMWFFTSFDITWYAEAAIYAKNLLFSQWNWQSDKFEWGEKCHYQVTYFLNGPIFLYFFVILFYLERKWLLMRKLVTIVPLKSKLSGKCQRFNAIDGSIKMLKIVEFSKI